MTSSAREWPAFDGIPGVVSALNTTLHIARVEPNGMLTGPFWVPAEPVKSTVKASSVIVSVAFMVIGSSEIPSSSMMSSADQEPRGRLARARAVVFSP